MSHPDREGKPLPRLTLLEQRTIEARIAGPLILAFVEHFGSSEVLPIVQNVISKLAQTSGAELAETLGDASLPSFSKSLERWKEADALQLEVLQSDAETLDFNVRRCRYAEMYRSLGLEDLGFSLSCVRDFALVQGFNPDIELQRTQTLMEGAPYCDFRFRAKPESQV